MKRTLISLCLLLPAGLCAVVPAANLDQRGTTGLDPIINSGPVIWSPATSGAPLLSTPKQFLAPGSRRTDDWILLATDSLTVSIPEYGHLAVRFDPATEGLSWIDPTVELSATQTAAIARAPAWLRADLYDNFRRFTYPAIADAAAQMILDAQDPLVDEIAFQVAHIAPGLLDGIIYLGLLPENAQYVYVADSSLEYVEIVDYGTSSDDDYYSTARYRVIEESGDTVQVEVDPDIYYWYVVHPKLSDETPAYINPANGQVTAPPVGVFWRTYFWTHADSGYTLLADTLGDSDFLWAHLTNVAGPTNGGVGLANDWVNEAMNWNVGPERPIQPVRIYTLHQGYCGEHSDITAAAGRTALIPTICTTDFCEDHTWNEFWDRDWIAWEPVNNYVNSPLVYENGWGKVISAVYNWRGDGYVWTVTDRYSEDVCTLNVTILDSLGKPADGERITIQSNAEWGGFYYATWGITNSLGEVSFLLGDAQNFYLRVDGPLGNYPLSGVVQVIGNSVAGQTYTWEHSMLEYSPTLELIQAPDYPDPLDDYLLEVNYEVEYESVYGTYFSPNQFAEKMSTGIVDFFLANQENYDAYSMFEPVAAFDMQQNSGGGSSSFVLPTGETWYALFSSRELSINRPRVQVAVNVYRNSLSVPQTPPADLPHAFALRPPYPNPFNPATVLSFELPVASLVTLEVFDIQSQRVGIGLAPTRYPAGTHEITFDGSDLPSGVYLVRLQAGDYQAVQKMVLMK